MDIYERTGYLDICIGYRIISIILTTIVYLTLSILREDQTPGTWYISLGMLSACFLGCHLYRKMEGQKGWTRLTLGLEMLAYGIFTFFSGGIFSPYLWYFLGCLLIMITTESRLVIIPLGVLWCFLCLAAGRLLGGITFQEINICLGMLSVIGVFYVLRCYIGHLNMQRVKLEKINLQLSEEKERSERAFLQLTNLYETVNLFAMTNPDQIVNELTDLLRRTIAPSGCILMKVNTDGNIEYLCTSGIGKENTKLLTEQILSDGWGRYFADKDKTYCFNLEIFEIMYDVLVIKDDSTARGLFICPSENRNPKPENNESFYLKLIEIVFHNMDIHNQIEQYIATEEQNRIANEIHDTVIQKLFGMACNMKIIELELDQKDQQQLRDRIKQLKQSAELTIKELRGAIYGRRFENGSGSSFVDSLRCYMEETERLRNTNIILMIESEADNLPAAQKIIIYRIACEAVNNAIRHGKADQIEVNLVIDYEQIKLTVKDNGQGFLKAQSPGNGRGIRNMRRLAGMMKGQLVLETQSEKGTSVNLSISR